MKHLNVYYDGYGKHQLVGQLAMDTNPASMAYQD